MKTASGPIAALINRGEAQLVIGTHALIEEKVEFDRLGLVVVDEQHRFGVLQRFKLMKKPNQPEPDVLVMTATPDSAHAGAFALRRSGRERTRRAAAGPHAHRHAPRARRARPTRCGTLCASRWRRSGRPTLSTRSSRAARTTSRSWISRMTIRDGRDSEPRQFRPKEDRRKGKTADLFPGISAQEAAPKSKGAELKSAVDMHEKLRTGPLAGLRVGLLHGRLDADEKEIIMRRFQRGEIDVLVATTVIEVGVDVPNATVMVVEHAERFGLAQLHQLRGRVGRGAAKSYCILMTGQSVSELGEERLNAMVRTQDGFELAELDLSMRGPGEFFGTRQAGLPDFRVANLVRDRALLELAKQEAERFATVKPGEGTEAERARVWARLKRSLAAALWPGGSRVGSLVRGQSTMPFRLPVCHFNRRRLHFEIDAYNFIPAFFPHHARALAQLRKADMRSSGSAPGRRRSECCRFRGRSAVRIRTGYRSGRCHLHFCSIPSPRRRGSRR